MTVQLANDGPVVMVDDNAGDLFFVQRCYMASKLENTWLPFTRGIDFLAHLSRVKVGEAPMPALVLLDLNMPGMTGLEVLQATRAEPEFAALPIFCVLTSSTDPRDRELAVGYGATGFRTKASNADEYIAFFDALTR
jgi:CheY-like chemotaxis protein